MSTNCLLQLLLLYITGQQTYSHPHHVSPGPWLPPHTMRMDPISQSRIHNGMYSRSHPPIGHMYYDMDGSMAAAAVSAASLTAPHAAHMHQVSSHQQESVRQPVQQQIHPITITQQLQNTTGTTRRPSEDNIISFSVYLFKVSTVSNVCSGKIEDLLEESFHIFHCY